MTFMCRYTGGNIHAIALSCLGIMLVWTCPDLSIAQNLSGRERLPAPFRVAAQHEAKSTDKAAKITEDEARKIALEAVPGKVTDVEIEKKLGANRYVVEVIAKADGAEIDVIIDMESGKVLAIDR